MNTKVKTVLLLLLSCLGMQYSHAQWYVGGSLGYSENLTQTQMLHFSPEAGYSFNPHWTAGLSTDLRHVVSQTQTTNAAGESVTVKSSHFLWYLNPYVRYSFPLTDKLSLFADAAASVLVTQGGDLEYIGIRPGVSYMLSDRFAAVAHVGFIGSYSGGLMAEVSLNQVEFSLYYLFPRKTK